MAGPRPRGRAARRGRRHRSAGRPPPRPARGSRRRRARARRPAPARPGRRRRGPRRPGRRRTGPVGRDGRRRAARGRGRRCRRRSSPPRRARPRGPRPRATPRDTAPAPRPARPGPPVARRRPGTTGGRGRRPEPVPGTGRRRPGDRQHRGGDGQDDRERGQAGAHRSSIRSRRAPPGPTRVVPSGPKATACSVRVRPVTGSRVKTEISLTRRRPLRVAGDVDGGVQGRGDLRVDRGPRQPGQGRQGLEAGGHVGGRVGVHRAAAALVPGVHRGQQVGDLGPAHLADHEPVRPHPQRLPDEVGQGDGAGELGVGRTTLHPDDVRVGGRELAASPRRPRSAPSAGRGPAARRAAWSCRCRCRR